MKIHKDLSLEYDLVKQYQERIDDDPILDGNFSRAVERLIERELIQKNLEAPTIPILRAPKLSDKQVINPQQTILSFLEKTNKQDVSKELNQVFEVKRLAHHRDLGHVMKSVATSRIVKINKGFITA